MITNIIERRYDFQKDIDFLKTLNNLVMFERTAKKMAKQSKGWYINFYTVDKQYNIFSIKKIQILKNIKNNFNITKV
jgi:hypothetical protein